MVTTMGDALHTAGPSPLAVNPAQAAQLIGVTRSTIYLLIASGELPSFTVGRARRIRISDIDEWITRRIAAEASSGRIA